jgi:hypothetical protein
MSPPFFFLTSLSDNHNLDNDNQPTNDWLVTTMMDQLTTTDSGPATMMMDQLTDNDDD